MASYWALKKWNSEIWEDTGAALGRPAIAKKAQTEHKIAADVQQDKAPVLAWESTIQHCTVNKPRRRAQGVRSVQRSKRLAKRDLQSNVWRKKMSPLVPAALTKGFSCLILSTARTISANYAAPAPAHCTVMTNSGYSSQEKIPLNMS